MGWDFIIKAFALSLGFRVIDLLVDALQLPTTVADPIQLLYAIGVLAFLGVSLVSAFKVIFRGPQVLR
jgi:hypothetical protein